MSDDEFRWLTYRAKGGFGLVMTCAAYVQRVGQGFPGQLNIWRQHRRGSHAWRQRSVQKVRYRPYNCIMPVFVHPPI